MKHITLIAALLLAGCAHYTPAQKVAEFTYQSIAAVDYSQTSNIARRPDCLHEGGFAEPFLGTQPSQTRVSAFFALSAAAHYGITSWLAREADATGAEGWYATLWTWELGTIAFEAGTVANNWKRGVRPAGHNLTMLCNSLGDTR